MNQTFKRAMSLFMALAMVLSMVPSFGTHVHAEELETEPVVQTEAPAAEAPVVETPVEEVPETEAPTQAPETEAPATEAPEIVETEAPEVTEEAPEVVETEAAEETEPVEETEEVTPDATEETLPEEFLEEEIVEEEAVMATIEGATPEGTCTVDGLEIRYDAEITEARPNHTLIRVGKAEWKVNGNKLSGDLVGGHGNRRTAYYRYEVNSTLTLKNTKNEGAELSFSYTLNLPDGEATIDGTTYTKTVSEPVLFVKVLQPGEFITINLVANPNTQQNSELPDNGSSIVITSLNLATFGNVNITYSEAVGGNYKVTNVAGEEYTVPGDVSVPATEWLTMTAMPDAGYAFAGWYNATTESYISADLEYTTLFDKDYTIEAKFIPAADGVYGVGEACFVDFNIAAQAAAVSETPVVVLLKDVTLTGSYTIPEDVTLLIPYDEEHTFNAEDPDSLTVTYSTTNPYVKPAAFRTLTMADGASITVNGAISVNARHTSCVGGAIYGGTVYKTYGEIKMQGNSKITLNKGANLYAWGYIWGSGTVEALNGATIYEKMQITDYRGGSNTASIAQRNMPDKNGNVPESADRAFPFNQYYIQNVEVKEILHEGATLMAHAAVNLAGETPAEAAVEFIGAGSAMFKAKNATITKEYNADTDRLSLSIDGDEDSTAQLNGMSLTLMEQTVNSAFFVLPINSNIDININAGYASVDQDLVLQPGVRVNVAFGAELCANNNIYVMDIEQWGPFVFGGKYQQPVVYAPSLNGGSNRVINSDAIIDINGFVGTSAGIFTTMGGAKIISSEGTGEIEFSVDAPGDSYVYQITGGKDAFAIPVTSAVLTNGNPGYPYTETKDAVTFDFFYYCTECDTWQLDGEDCVELVKSYEVTWDLNGGYAIGPDGVKCTSFKDDYNENETPDYGNRPVPVKDSIGCKTYTFAGWKDAEGKEYPIGTALPAATTDATYYAYFTETDAHSFNTARGSEKTAGTCMTKAVYAVKCDNCEAESDTLTVEGEVNPAKHTGNNHFANGFAATCGKDGHEGDIICECGTKVGEGNPIPATGNHSFTNKPSDKKKDDATCISGATYYVQCDNCDEVDYKKTVAAGEADPANHVKTHVASEWTRGENNDHFRWRVCDGCESNIAKENVATCVDSDRDGDHNCNLCGRENITDHFGGTANCQSPAICEECKTAYGKKAPDFHAGEVTVSYLNTQEHKTTFSCCEGVELIEEHNDESEDDACDVCGAIQVVVVKLFPAGENTLWAEAGKDFVYSLSDENYNLLAGAMAAGGAHPVYTVVKKGETGALTIPEISSYHMIQVAPVYIGSVSFNGGTFAHKAMGEMYKSMGLTVTDECHEAVVPVGSGASYTEDTYSRDGWNLVGYKVNGTEYPVGESYAVAADGFVVDLIWKCAGHVYDNDCDVDCNKCGETREVEDHVSDAAYPCLPGKCKICGADVAASVNHSFTKYVSNKDASCTADGTETAKCDYNCGASDTRVAVGSQLGHSFTKYVSNNDATCTEDGTKTAKCDRCDATDTQTDVGSKLNHEWGTPTYEDNKDGTHTVTYVCVLDGINTDTKTESHTFENGECVCEAKQTFTLTVSVRVTGEDVELTVPYGANLLDVLDQAVADKKIPAIDEIIRYDTWEDIVTGYSYKDENGEWIYDLKGLTMPAGDFAIDQDCEVYRGWQDYVVGMEYVDPEKGSLEGWNYIEDDFDGVEGGAWYYFQEGTGEWEDFFFRVEGVARVPYPTVEIDGVKYAPNAEDMAYDDFIDADEAWFIFDEAGKFQFTETGMGTYFGETRYAENGHIAWHPGMIEVEGEYYYFLGDVEKGGNIMATGDVHVSRDNSGFGAVKSGIYTFGEDGKLCKYDGITDMADGSKRYYENAQLMIGKGLVKIGENYIFVRSNGQLVVNGKYWIGQNEFGLVQGMYEFDENGYLVNPMSTEKSGVHAEDGSLYYYENGKRTYAGLIEYEGNIIYVKSNGELATGKYWVTKTNGMEGYAAGFYFFDEEGRMMANRNGIVSGKDVSGNDVLYYYINNEIAYGAGLIKLENGYIYVKSNGQVATGLYWITNTNGMLPAAKYEFDENGYMVTNVNLDGIVEENDALYYYIKGIKQYGLGLVEIDGKYIYVKTNGELATGKYWVTNVGESGLKQGVYNFGTDGYMIVEN